jgi:hypothetical protein
VFRVWWLSIGKAKVTTDTARLREEYALDRKTQFERAVLIREASPQMHRRSALVYHHHHATYEKKRKRGGTEY